MKKLLALAVCVLMLVGMMSPTASAHRGYVYQATYGTPEIDGVKDEIWNSATLCKLIYTSGDGWDQNPKAVPMAPYYFAVMNDDEFIYLFFEFYDLTPGDDDMMEFHIDEDFCRMPGQKLKELYPDTNFCPCAYHFGAMFSDPDITIFGCRGSETLNADGSQKDIIIDCKGTQSPMTIPEGACEYRTLELKIKPVREFSAGTVIGIEASLNDRDEDGEWVNFLRWNTDELRTYDVKDGYPEDEIDEYDGEGQWPYWSTYTYAPCTLAGAPSEEPATDAPAPQPPKTADAGIVVSAVVMAAAAAVVLSKRR